MPKLALPSVNDDAFSRVQDRLAAAAEERTQAADVDAALERARAQVEQLAELTANLETSLPERVGNAVRDGVRAEALPVARQMAEVRGLAGQTIRRLERLEGQLLAERRARLDDLSLLVDLVSSGWKGVDRRLDRLERGLGTGTGAIVYPVAERGWTKGGGTADSAGRTSWNRLPRPTSLSSLIRPPSATASSRAIASPSPVPAPSRETNGRKMRSCSSGGIP